MTVVREPNLLLLEVNLRTEMMNRRLEVNPQVQHVRTRVTREIRAAQNLIQDQKVPHQGRRVTLAHREAISLKAIAAEVHLPKATADQKANQAVAVTQDRKVHPAAEVQERDQALPHVHLHHPEEVQGDNLC